MSATLELLDALAGEHATLTAAARHLYVSQPALSQRLLRLEERLATPLFERRGRRLVANAAGRRMLHAAQITLRELRTARLDLRELADGRRRPLRLASQCATNYEWMADVARSLHQRLPDAELRVEPLPDDEPIAALLDDRLDVALVTKLDHDVNRVRLEHLFDDELRAVVKLEPPRAHRASVAATDFDEVHLVLCDSYDQAKTPAVPLPIPAGAQPARLTTVAAGPDILIELVATGDVVTVIPSWIVAPYPRHARRRLGRRRRSTPAPHVVLRHPARTERRHRRRHRRPPHPPRRPTATGASELSSLSRRRCGKQT